MKKLFLVLLLLPFVGTSQDFKIGMNYSGNVGEEIQVKFELFPPSGETTMPATLLQFDIQYNNKLLQYVSHVFDPYNKLTNESNTRNAWTGYKFNPDMDYMLTNLYQQYQWWLSGASAAGANSYPTNPDFSVNRYTIQASEDINIYDAVLIINFKVLDRSTTNYANYSGALGINWANLRDNRDGTVYQLTSSNKDININPSGVGAGDVTINLSIPHDNQTDYGYSIYAESQLEGVDFDEDGTIDAYYPKADEVPFVDGTFDANGTSSVSTMTLDEKYWIHTHVIQTSVEVDGQTIYGPDWLDDVVTVTDVYKVFQYAASGNIGGGSDWEYTIQGILGEVTNDTNVNFEDSYELLAHINGVTTSANVTSRANGTFNLSALMDVYGLMDGSDWHTFTPTENNKSFTLGHGLRGDVDFSHSTVPTAQNAAVETTAKTSTMQIMANRAVEEGTLDVSSRLSDGKVYVDVNLGTEGLVGSQFKIVYDSSRLTLDDIVYDTGNTMTNFGTVKNSIASFGSLDFTGDSTIKSGTPYKLIFTPKEQITNTAGLISFKIVEGVKADGTKVKFQY